MRRLPVPPSVIDFSKESPWVTTWLQILGERLNTVGGPTVPTINDIPAGQWGVVRNDSTSNVAIVASDGSNVRGLEFPIATTARFLAGVVRYSGGAWEVQSDATHVPLSISSATPITLGYGDRLRIGLTSVASQVGSIILEPDNALAKMGFLACGGEVGTTAADFELPRMVGIRGGFFWSAGTISTQYASSYWPFTATDLGGGVVRITHDKVYDTYILPQLTTRNGFYAPELGSFGDTFFDIHFPVTSLDSSCGCVFTRMGQDIVSPYDGYSNPDGNFWLYGVMHV